MLAVLCDFHPLYANSPGRRPKGATEVPINNMREALDGPASAHAELRLRSPFINKIKPWYLDLISFIHLHQWPFMLQPFHCLVTVLPLIPSSCWQNLDTSSFSYRIDLPKNVCPDQSAVLPS